MTETTDDALVARVKEAIRHTPMADGDGLCVWLDESHNADRTLSMGVGPSAGRAKADAMLDDNLTRIAAAAVRAMKDAA